MHNFVIAGVDGVIHQRDFTSVKINVNMTLITVLVDVTYSTNQSWFVAKILENKYNLFFYWYFSRWEIILLNGINNSLKEYSLQGVAVETHEACGNGGKEITEVWKNYSAIKKNTFESVLMRWMKLEPIIQSEVSQKEKHQYSILTHIYGI